LKKNTTLKRLLKVGSFTELFGLIRGYRIEKVIQKIKVWGLTGKKFWSREGVETILAPYRNYAKQENLSEKAIDETLQSFAKATETDLNLVRRVFYQIVEAEPEEKPEESPEELSEEAEEDLPEFEEDKEEETVEETDTE